MEFSDTLTLPDGTVLRGRGLRNDMPPGEPEYGLYLGGSRLRAKHDAELTWPHEWIRWPDFWLPSDTAAAIALLDDLHRRALSGQRVEVACGGGRGRTGTAIAFLATRAGLTPADAITWTRANLHPRAIETPWQKRWIARNA